MRKLILATAATCALAQPAWAAKPVDLACNLDAPTKKRTIEFTLDEDQATATWQWNDSSSPVKRAAIFTATKVTVATFTIDRSSLVIEQANPDFLIEQGYPAVSVGKCQIKKVERAF